MDEFRLKLGEQVNDFTEQAVAVDRWDRQLIEQRDRALGLHEGCATLKLHAAALNAELELILQRQDEMHGALSVLEKKVDKETRLLPPRAGERQQAYELAEGLDKELGEMRETLNATVERLNKRRALESTGAAAGQLAQLVQVLNVHLNAFQWLDSQGADLDAMMSKLEAQMASNGEA